LEQSVRLTAVVILLALITPVARAQRPISGAATLTVRGVVVTANDTPLPRVRVAPTVALPPELAKLGAFPESARGVLTDDRGRFTIQVLATGSTRLAFTKARYTTHTADISSRELTATSSIRVRMSLAGAITGRVIDRSGTGVMLSLVTLQRAGAAAADAPILTMTNDVGEFRFGGLAEGTYAIASRPPPSAPGVPGVFSDRGANAATVQGPTVSVSLGAEVGNISLTIDMPSELDQDAARRTNPDPAANGSLSGRVVSLDGTPIARAVVLVYRPSIPAREVETDARGRYRIDRLSPGEYVVEARKWGFETRRYGQDRMVAARSSGIVKRVELKNGQAVDSIDVMLARGGVIAGTIVDEFGEPMEGVPISALQLSSGAGHLRWVRSAVLGSSRTDDRGQYRLFGLLPGTYVVQAAVRDSLSPASGYLPFFFPGTPSIAQATTTKVDFAMTATGIDLSLRATIAHTLIGVVLDSSGRPPVRAEVTLAVSERSGAIQTEPLRVNAAADGAFAFTNVGPGVYAVQATGDVDSKGLDARTSVEQFAASFVTVTGNDPPRLELRLAPGARLAGRVRYEGVPADPPPLFNLAPLPTNRDLAPPLGDGWNSVELQPDDTFEFQGVFGPTLLRELFQEADWYLKSVVIRGQEQVDSPFDFGASGTFSDIEVLISAFGATVTGRVTDDRAAPVRDCAVVVFSTFRDRWSALSRWVKTTEHPSSEGTFTVRGLPPGDYWVAAIERRDSAFEPTADPDLLESLSSRAVRITLGEGQSQDLTLRLVRR
jgi:hypothetical protein